MLSLLSPTLPGMEVETKTKGENNMTKTIKSQKPSEYGKKYIITAPTEKSLNDFASHIELTGGRYPASTLKAYRELGYDIQELAP